MLWDLRIRGGTHMSRKTGTVTRGVRCPIIRENDDLAHIVVNSVIEASQNDGFELNDMDIVGLTESIVARAQGNYASVDAIVADLKAKFPGDTLGVVFPILSRNRFETILKAIARAFKHVVILLDYPSDEVGNPLISLEQLDASDYNPYKDVLTLQMFRDAFGASVHPFTHIDYIDVYTSVVEAEGAEVTFLFSKNPKAICNLTKQALVCNVHDRARTLSQIEFLPNMTVYGLEHILAESVMGSGYNEDYGLLGCNRASDDSVKLFPRDSQEMVEKIQSIFFETINKRIEVMVYGDGAFKDPVGHIWELADPVVSPGFTSGLVGTPHEIKLKYLADNQFKGLEGAALDKAIHDEIAAHATGGTQSLGTTPRRIVDLVGSLCDLTSGSGDKGTPIVLVQGYFDHYGVQ